MMHGVLEKVSFPDQVKDTILKNSSKHVFAGNSIIYLQEDKADKFFIVLCGHVRLSYILEDGSSICYGIVPPGQSFGELGVYNQSVYLDTASAVGLVSLLSVKADLFHSNAEIQVELKSALSNLVAQKYNDYINSTRNLYFRSLTERLSMCLLELAKTLGQTTYVDGKPRRYIGSVVNQSDLGDMARGTRGNVNRVLKGWERDGLIVMEDRRIVLLDPLALEHLASG